MQTQESKVPGETVFGLLMVGVSIFLLWQAYKISGFSTLSSAGVFPMSAAFIMLVFSCVTVVNNYGKNKTKFTFSAFKKQVIPNLVSFMIALVITYSVLLESIGFLITSLVFLIVSISVLYKNGMVRTLFISLLSIFVIYAIFRLAFSVVLPEGIVPEGEILAYIAHWFA
ncbi:tripartite tricarboxylate transporter TctB family protein [Vibrio mangrovi]|uniref:Tripartite tricarboxylate transporter TctB family protein n=1 Tax=Vibrio mangrovi TaxID=474394 RepID=A0A1Y6IY28_9VIBR|nr:tripartite tricarboxylate transporter TctB family protein [Vibrio mangrovi]MDW6005232.1 tripartite tricarboxylate transporter TctB family protein [Vibrio mangrovi]SMS02557.1 Tripartite tricarboxylate transporter TctB family protein [Vibrio mangrovi]